MKKYVIFIISFILLFSLLLFASQLLLGSFLTLTYSPDLDAAWEESAALSQQVEVAAKSGSLFPTIVVALLSATFAYLISKRFERRI